MKIIRTWSLHTTSFDITDYHRLTKLGFEVSIIQDTLNFKFNYKSVTVPSQLKVNIKTNSEKHETLLKLLYCDNIQLISEEYNDNWCY